MNKPIALAYVGSVVPDRADFRNEAFSRAGNMFQENLLAGLQAAGLTPSVVLSCRPMPAFPRSKRLLVGPAQDSLAGGITVVLAPFLNWSPVKQCLAGLWVFASLLRWGWKHKAAARVVYTYNLTMPPGLFTFLAARCIGARAVASVNDINEPGGNVPRAWPWRLDYALHRILLPCFDGLVVVSGAISRELAPLVPHLRVEGGLTPEMMLDESSDAAPASPHRFRVVFAGRMKASNGVATMLQAIGRIQGGHYHFVFAGDGPLSEAVRRAATEDPRIDFRGFLKVDDLLPIYKQADLLINMRLTKEIRTRYFFPSKLMELLASGTPVLSTCTGHVEEEFGEFLFPLRNETAEGLAEGIQNVERIQRQMRQELGKRARAYMLAHKSWRKQTERIAWFLHSLAGEPAEGSASCR